MSRYDPMKWVNIYAIWYYNRFKRWSEMGIFDKIFKELSSMDTPDQLQIDATHLKAHRTACSLLKKGAFPAVLAAQKGG